MALAVHGFALVQQAPVLPSGSQVITCSAIIDWRSFSIGAGGQVDFNNGGGITLNRVSGGAPSSIAGQLNATGSLYLVNPPGWSSMARARWWPAAASSPRLLI